MRKSQGKIKTGKDKNKKDNKTDEGQTKIAKDKFRPRNASRKRTVAEIRSSSPETALSQRNSQIGEEVSAEARKRKSCEDAVKMAVAEFFDCAWLSCAERFFITSAPVTVSVELRNTWLRIVEAEWQDPDMREKTSSSKPNRIFRRDEPPLPLAYDTWSRGAMKPLPGQRRESVLDPFLRDIYVSEDLPFTDNLGVAPSLISEDNMEKPEVIPPKADTDDEAVEHKKLPRKSTLIPAKTGGNVPESAKDISTGDEWNFELDPKLSYEMRLKSIVVSPKPSPLGNEDQLSPGSQLSLSSEQSSLNNTEKIRLVTLLSAKPLHLNDSITEVEDSTINLKSKSKKGLAITKPRKFSPSQCGGNVGSAVFRLLQETTTEALLNTKTSQGYARIESSHIMEQNADERDGIVQISKKGQITDDTEEEFVVQPLFEERTERSGSDTDGSQRFQLDINRRLSFQNVNFKARHSKLYEVASEATKMILKRRMVHLQSQFKRQAIRSLAGRKGAHQEGEGYMSTAMRDSASVLSKTSVGSRSSIKTNQSRNKGDHRNTTMSKMSYKSNTFSGAAGAVVPGNKMAPLLKSFAAKGTVSEPALHRGNAKREKDEKHDLNSNKIPGKSNFSFQKAMANVRASQQRELRSLGGKFHDDKRTPAQLGFHIENRRKLSFVNRKQESINAEVNECPSVKFCPTCLNNNLCVCISMDK